MIDLIVNNVFTEIRNADKETEFAIWDELSFTIQEFNTSPYYAPKIRHLYNRKTHFTYTGLLPYVTKLLEDREEEFRIVDKRVKHRPNANFKLVKFLDKAKKIPFKLRDYQQELVDKAKDREIIQSCTGSGKALTLDTPVLTPYGFVPIRDIHVNDIVFDERGRATKVIGEFPQGKKTAYKITFDDGSSVTCCNEHLWKFTTDISSDNIEFIVKNTDDMIEMFNYLDIYIPINKPIRFDKHENISNISPFSIGKLLFNKEYQEANVLEIFNRYLLSNVEDRLQLLHGIVSEYGKICDSWLPKKIDECSCSTDTYKFEKDGIRFLIHSLGYRSFPIGGLEEMESNISVSDTAYEYRSTNILRKQNVMKIASIEEAGQQEMKCIAVSSHFHTYICGDFIVTHNTAIMAALVAKFNVRPVSIFADKLSLCSQLRDEFSKFLGTEVGLVGGGINERKDITVFSVQSATEDMVKDTKLMLVDECFVYETPIQLANGITKKIGDIVDTFNEMKEKGRTYRAVTFNHETGEKENKNILSVSKIPIGKKSLRVVLIKDKEESKKITKLVCTEDHPFYIVEEERYMPVDEIEEGMTVKFLNGKEGTIFKIVQTPKKEEYVYNIETDENHNYYANGVLVHNCHHLASDSLSTVSRWCKDAYYRIGVSATPWREDGADLLIYSACSKINEELKISASYLIQKGYLVPCTIYWVNQKQVFKGRNYNRLYNEAIVNNLQRNVNIIKLALQMRKYKDATILILIQRVEHGEKLLEMLKKYIPEQKFSMTVQNPKTNKDTLVSVNAVEFLSGKDDEIRRRGVIAAVKENKCRILIASTIGDEGLDIPSISCVILAGGGKSSTRAYQRIGRALRLYTNPETGKKKEIATIFDFCDYSPIFRRQARIRDKLYRAEPEWNIRSFPEHLLDFQLKPIK